MAANAKTIAALLDQIAQHGEQWKVQAPGARESLMTSCSKLFSSLILPGESIALTQWAQPTHNSVLRLGSEIDLFRALAADDGRPKSSRDIAEKSNPRAEQTLVARMLRLLASMNTVIETGPDMFAPTPFALAMTQEAFKDSVALMQDDLQPMMIKQTEYFKEIGYKTPNSSLNAPLQYAYDCRGTHLFELFAKYPLMGKRFANMMQVWSQDRPKWFEEGYYPVKERLIDGAVSNDDNAVFLVDVGGGSGHDVAQLLEAFGDAIPGKLVLQDRPEVIEIAKEDQSLSPQIVKMSHDFLTDQPVHGARAYYLHSIIQDWDDSTNQLILRSLIPAMKPGYSRILLNDYVIPDQGAHWLQTAVDWELMASLGARHRTEEEMRRMIEGAGLKIVQIFKHSQSIDSLIEVDIA